MADGERSSCSMMANCLSWECGASIASGFRPYNWHLAWLGLDRPLLPMPEDPGDQQRKLMDRLGISYVMTPLGRKFPTTTNERKANG